MNAPFDYRLFGLEPRDLKVYEALLAERDAVSIRAVADLVKMNRGTTYEIIKKLHKLGLISSHMHSKRKYYVAQNPDMLRAHAQDTQRSVASELTNIEQYVIGLKHLQPKSSVEQFTQFYDGEEEIAALLNDVLETVGRTEHKTYQVISSAQVRSHLYGKFRNFTKKRIALGITVQVIGVGELGSKATHAHRRLLTDTHAPAAYIIIYADKVAQISLPETGYIQGTVVHNDGIAQLQRLMFEQLWQTLSEVTS